MTEIEAMIVRAEAELAALKLRLEREDRVPNPSDPFDPVHCLEIWLAALYATRAGPLSSRPN